MRKLEIVRQWMAEGKILHPLERNPNIVDLTRTLMTLCGYREFKETHWIKVLKRDLHGEARHLRPSDHYIFVLVDGLGRNLSDFFPPGGFFDSHFVRELRSVFPSTTASAMTSLVTGEWPGVHGLTGWFTHLPEFGRTAKILPFVDRFTGTPMEDYGADMGALVPVKSLFSSLEREVCVIMPSSIRSGAYSNWANHDTQVLSYRSLSGGFQAAAANVQNRTKPSFTFFYVPDVDTAEHEGGTSSAKVRRLIKSVDEALTKLTSSVPAGTKIVVAADHGLVDVPTDRRVHLTEDHPMLGYLSVAPSGEAAMPIFHVREGRERQFEEFFATSYGTVMELLSISDVEALGLFGNDGISSLTRRRLGNYIGIAVDPFVMIFDGPGDHSGDFVAFHGGLQPEAMAVPLFVA